MFAQGRITTDRNVIKKWVKARRGWPAIIQKMSGTGIEMALSIIFPDSQAEVVLKKITWEEFFEQFDKQQLVFVYKEIDQNQQKSRYFALL